MKLEKQSSSISGSSELRNVQPKGFPSLPLKWTQQWETFLASDRKISLFGVNFQSDEPVKRHLFVLHGLGEHSGRYFHFPHYLQGSVQAISLYDHRGHGRSEGNRGHVESYNEYTEDAVCAIRRVSEAYARKGVKPEYHLLGHSMGGLIALRLLAQRTELPLKSVAVSAPLLGIRVQVPWFKKFAARGLASLMGSLQMNNEINPEHLSHDPHVVDAYKKDRLVHSRVTPRFFTELEDAMSGVLALVTGKLHEIPCPILFQVPLEDQVVDPDAAIALAAALSVGRKKLITYPGYFHEIFNEGGVAKVTKELPFKDLGQWIEDPLP